jgi:hypothetical protein
LQEGVHRQEERVQHLETAHRRCGIETVNPIGQASGEAGREEAGQSAHGQCAKEMGDVILAFTHDAVTREVAYNSDNVATKLQRSLSPAKEVWRWQTTWRWSPQGDSRVDGTAVGLRSADG